jgi:hypothetical protein
VSPKAGHRQNANLDALILVFLGSVSGNVKRTVSRLDKLSSEVEAIHALLKEKA